MSTNIATNLVSAATNSVGISVESVQPVEDLVSTILSMSPATLLLVSLVVFGKVLKTTPLNNKWIPAILFPAGAVGWCLLTSWSMVHFLQGHLFGGCAVGLHQFWTLSIGDTFAAVLSKGSGWMGSLAAMMRRKPKDQKPADQAGKPPQNP